MRQRERNNLIPVPRSYPYTGVNTNGTSFSGTGGLNFDIEDGKFEIMWDVVTERFRARVKRGEIIVNPMTQAQTSRSTLLGPFAYSIPKTSGQVANYSQNWPKYPGVLNSLGSPLGHSPMKVDLARLQKLAGTQAAAGVDAPEFEGAIFLAELDETLRFLSNPLRNWNEFLRKLRKKKNLSRFHRQKTVSDYLLQEWLSLRYGVRPLVMDIQDAIKAVEAVVKNDYPERRTSRGFANDSETIHETNSPAASGASVTYKWTRKTVHEVNVRAGVLYEYHRAPDTFGVSYHDIPIAIWNGIRYSFIIDWFANIGPWIEAITPIAGVKIIGSWTKTEINSASVRDSYVFYGGIDASSGKVRNVSTPGNTQEKFASVQNDRSDGITVGIAAKVSPLSGWRGGLRVLDLVAISNGLLKSR